MTAVRAFTYTFNDARVIFADGALKALGSSVDDAIGASRILVVSTPGRAMFADRAREALGHRLVASFDKARLHVPVDIVSQAHETMLACNADCLVAIGGGSPIGLGKALSRESGLPLVAIPTTYAGSEMTDIWGITDENGKRTGRDKRVAPKLVVYDPDLTRTMPPHVAGPSGMNAIAHAVEAMYSESASPISSLIATEGIRLLSAALPALNSERSESHAVALLGAHYCARALDMTTMGLHHKLCHVLGGLLDLPHALTHAVVLPYATAYNAPAASSAMSRIGEGLGGVSCGDVPARLWNLNRELGITQSLSDLGVRESDLDRIVEQATTRAYPNPREVTTQGIRNLLEQAMSGERPAME